MPTAPSVRTRGTAGLPLLGVSRPAALGRRGHQQPSVGLPWAGASARCRVLASGPSVARRRSGFGALRAMEAGPATGRRDVVEPQVLFEDAHGLAVDCATVEVAEAAERRGVVALATAPAALVEAPQLLRLALAAKHPVEEADRQREALREAHESKALAEPADRQPRLAEAGPAAIVDEVGGWPGPAIPRQHLHREALHSLCVLPKVPRQRVVRPAVVEVVVGRDDLLARLTEHRHQVALHALVRATHALVGSPGSGHASTDAGHLDRTASYPMPLEVRSHVAFGVLRAAQPVIRLQPRANAWKLHDGIPKRAPAFLDVHCRDRNDAR
mmetsp:Transcript_105140/g.339107  ORF Transcript_105140/g.339107 Transcript_105140/m.339107 type:complete len:328 (+) Transcript_105140:285-1268(+)